MTGIVTAEIIFTGKATPGIVFTGKTITGHGINRNAKTRLAIIKNVIT